MKWIILCESIHTLPELNKYCKHTISLGLQACINSQSTPKIRINYKIIKLD
jgi:hypothetical protein